MQTNLLLYIKQYSILHKNIGAFHPRTLWANCHYFILGSVFYSFDYLHLKQTVTAYPVEYRINVGFADKKEKHASFFIHVTSGLCLVFMI